MSEVSKRTVFFLMVDHPLKGWTRVGNAYATREDARGWKSFVKASWRFCAVKVAQFTVRLVDGRPDAKSLAVLDKKYNLDGPAVAINPGRNVAAS